MSEKFSIKDYAAKNIPVLRGSLIIVRGVPGSGKSTFAAKLANEVSGAIFEADDYFIRPDGVYDFNYKLIENAHAHCFSELENYFDQCPLGVGILSNTSVKVDYFKKYVDFALERELSLHVFRMGSFYGSVHNVPESTIEKMKSQFEDFPGEITINEYE